ncbi:hypothetical protein I5080_07705 [Salmonella enterica]|nr:hypothetical protein I5080_07705 [Salmonella enterica]
MSQQDGLIWLNLATMMNAARFSISISDNLITRQKRLVVCLVETCYRYSPSTAITKHQRMRVAKEMEQCSEELEADQRRLM